MTNLLLASLCSVSVFACATSDADVVKPSAPHKVAAGAACAPGTDVLLHIDRRADRAEFDTSSFTLYTTGAWTFSASNKAARSGCLGKADLKALDDAFSNASWKYSTGPACEIYAPNFIDYHYRGTKVISLRRCDGKVLDASASTAITLATKTSTTAVTGDVVIEVAQDTSEPKTSSKWSFVVLASGAWTYVEYRDGKLLKQSGGMLSADQRTALKKHVAAATWTSKQADVACAAWSPDTTNYIIGGSIKAWRGTCDGQIFDSATEAAFSYIAALKTKLTV